MPVMTWRVLASFSDWIKYQLDVRQHMPEPPRSWLLNGPKSYPVFVPEQPWLLVGDKPVLPFLPVEDAQRLSGTGGLHGRF
jgi:hypothetical protein